MNSPNLNFDINQYSFKDIEKLFDVSSGYTLSDNDIDQRIAKILVSAKSQVDSDKYQNIHDFLIVAKQKYKIFLDENKIEYDNIYPITDRLKTMLTDNKFLDINDHAIIEQSKPIPQMKKYVHIDSSSRNINAFPYSTEFEFELPEAIKDITELNFYDWNLNFFVRNIASVYQNNVFMFKMNTINGSVATGGVGEIIELVIPDGQYSSITFVQYLSSAMNNAVKRISGEDYNNFNIILGNDNTQKIYFANYNFNNQQYDSFELIFNVQPTFPKNKSYNFTAYDRDTYWGLGYQLGFDKESYTSELTQSILIGNVPQSQLVISPYSANINLNGQVYLQIDGFNHIDKHNTVNSYFAKIPMLFTGYEYDYGGFETAVIDYERVQKLKIRLVYGNGTLVYTGEQNWDMTLLFTCKK